MTDIPPPHRDDEAAASGLRPARPVARRRRPSRVSLIWLVPIVALLVTAGLAWNALASRGPMIAVSFADATGITPGETALKFREVTVGKVETARFTDDLDRVVLDIRVDPAIAPYIGADATFWVVRPQVTTSGISRLDTVLTGTFIEGDWTASTEGHRPDLFTGLDRAPLIRSRDRGIWVVLSAPDASGLSDGAPVLFRGLEVGRMENLRLSPDDESVLADVFIDAPYDARLTTATSFWDVSGFSVSLGTQGLAVDVNSVSTLLQGGAEFATFASGGTNVAPGHVFRLYPDRKSAEAGTMADDEAGQVRVTILLPGDLRGLAPDAEVQFGGIRVGRVSDLAVVVPKTGPDADKAMQAVTLVLSPSRLGVAADEGAVLDWLAARVQAGLRARAASGGFMGLSVIVQLVEIPDAAPASLDMTATPHPLMPTTESDVQDIAGTAQGFLTRIGSLPLDETLMAAQDMMNAITAIATAEDTRAIPASIRATLDQIDATAQEIDAIASELRAQDASGRVVTAFDATTEAMESVRRAADEIPDMVEKIEVTVDKIDETVVEMQKVDYEGLGNAVQALAERATGLVEDLRAMLGTEDAAELPKNLSDTLKAASALLTELREGGAVGNLNAALDSARVAADAAGEAMRGLPDLTGRARALIARAETVIAAYGERSAFNTELLGLMREMRRASASFGSLARLIERNPRAFILGR